MKLQPLTSFHPSYSPTRHWMFCKGSKKGVKRKKTISLKNSEIIS